VIFLQPVDLETLKKQFKDYDVDGNGVLDKDELCEIFKKMARAMLMLRLPWMSFSENMIMMAMAKLLGMNF